MTGLGVSGKVSMSAATYWSTQTVMFPVVDYFTLILHSPNAVKALHVIVSDKPRNALRLTHNSVHACALIYTCIWINQSHSRLHQPIDGHGSQRITDVPEATRLRPCNSLWRPLWACAFANEVTPTCYMTNNTSMPYFPASLTIDVLNLRQENIFVCEVEILRRAKQWAVYFA